MSEKKDKISKKEIEDKVYRSIAYLLQHAGQIDDELEELRKFNQWAKKQILKFMPKCNCDGWGCKECCVDEKEIASRQGTYL